MVKKYCLEIDLTDSVVGRILLSKRIFVSSNINIELFPILNVIEKLLLSKSRRNMVRFMVKKCPTGCQVNFVYLRRNNLTKLVNARMKNEYRFQWGTFPRDKKNVQIFTLQYSLFKLWIVLTLLSMYPTIVVKFVCLLFSILFS